VVRADRDEEKGAEAFQKYGIRGTPTTIVLDGEGAEVDWIVGYGAPPEKFLAKVNRSVTGGETLKSLTAAHAANPKDAATAFKLGRKYAERADEAKALPLYKDVVALDPAGQAGSFMPDFMKAPVTYSQYAEYELARFPLQGRRDPAPMKAYIAKYPGGPMLRLAYSSLDIFYYGSAPAAETDAFYADYTAKFPTETWVLQKWLTRILQDKTSLGKGVAVADRLAELTESNPDPYAQAVLAEFYLARGDKAKAEEVFGRPFIDSHLSNVAFGLLQFADFWAQRRENTDRVETAVAAALKLQPENMFVRQQAAKVFLGLGRDEMAIEVFGPAYAKNYWDEPGELRSYIYFWTQQGKNLDGALAAGLRTVELRPRAYYHWSALADLFLKKGDKAKALDAAGKAVEFASPAAKPAMQKNLEKIKAQTEPPAPTKK
jgi:thioredoxin-like negative regulator of GroEL